MPGFAERTPARLPLQPLSLADLSLGPAVMADDPCQAASAAAGQVLFLLEM
jgi:hypothetical protein